MSHDNPKRGVKSALIVVYVPFNWDSLLFAKPFIEKENAGTKRRQGSLS
jgi:hypothetical protein